MSISLVPVTAENRAGALGLRVLPEQESFVESVAECLEEADQLAPWRPVCILQDGRLIGFSMYGEFFEEGEDRVWFDRLLLDARWQGRGWGKEAIRVILTRMRLEYPGKDIRLSVYEDNPHAIQLYEYYGFRFNGELDTKGEKVMLLPATSPLPQTETP